MDYIKAFLIGGLICAAVQILLDRTKLMPGRVMVLLVCTGAVLGFIGAHEPFVKFSGAGASVPLLGFGNVLWKTCLWRHELWITMWKLGISYADNVE